jgi:hypothetical protein
MTLEQFVLPELVKKAKWILEHNGQKALEDYDLYFGACGCVGPSKGERLCPCRQNAALKSNLVEVVNEFDPQLAKKIMIRRIVAALPG